MIDIVRRPARCAAALLLAAVTALCLMALPSQAFAVGEGESSSGKTASLSVSMPSEVYPGQVIDATITLTGNDGANIGSNNGSITLDGLQFQDAGQGETISATVFNSAFSDNNAKNVITWSATYKVTAEAGSTASISVSSTANSISTDSNYGTIEVTPASATAQVVSQAEYEASVNQGNEDNGNDNNAASTNNTGSTASKAKTNGTAKDDVPKTGYEDGMPVWPIAASLAALGAVAAVAAVVIRKKARR